MKQKETPLVSDLTKGSQEEHPSVKLKAFLSYRRSNLEVKRGKIKMTRAVAEKGVELVQGIHIGPGGLVITIKQANGLIREVPYDEGAVATPVLIEAMIQDKGIENPEIREAAIEYCLNYIKGYTETIIGPEIDGIPIGDLSCYVVEAFENGYEACLKKRS